MTGKMTFCILVVLLVSMATSSYAVGVDEQCDASADCITTNANSSCIRVFTSTSCTKGKCACDTGFIDNDCMPKPLPVDMCSPQSGCARGFSCLGSICVCMQTADLYRKATRMCVNSSLAVYDETCNDTMTCINIDMTYDSMNCSGTCHCARGYVHRSSSHICEMPHAGDACDASLGCRSIALPVTSDELLQIETCNNGTCKCPSNSTQYTASLGGTSYSYCLETTTATLKADGTTCTLHNECASKICAVCPTDAATNTKRCLRFWGATFNKLYNESCTHNTDCRLNFTCTNNKCACYNSTDTYSPATAMCVGPAEEANATDGIKCSTTCQCATGYVHRSGYCGIQTTATLKADGTTCTLHNECASNNCTVCPADETSTKRCIGNCTDTDTSGVSGFQATTGVLLIFVALKVIFV